MNKKKWQKNVKDMDCRYKEFLQLFPFASKELQDELMDKLKQQPRPARLCGVEVPKDLNALTYGKLDDLRSATGEKDPAGACARILLGVNPDDLLLDDVNDVFGFANFITSELTRINKIFKSIKVTYSKEEIAAGVEKLDFGSFGVLDWYARRMGITNQNEVREVAWVRIYQCLRNDAIKNEYERRLDKQYKPKKNH